MEQEIATILPARPDYLVTTSEFDHVKARLARIENKRALNDKKNGNKPTLRRTSSTNNDPNSPATAGVISRRWGEGTRDTGIRKMQRARLSGGAFSFAGE